MSIIACAYKGTGKDTLCKKSKTGLLVDEYDPKLELKAEYSWLIYAGAEQFKPYFSPDVTRIASADPLKAEVHAYLGLPPGDYEAVKDTLTVVDPISRQLKVLRQHYIDYGNVKRRENPVYWPTKAAKPHIQDLSKEQLLSFHYFVTDWRFFPEYNYFYETINSPLTIRLFRKDVPIPDKSIESEHSLDDIKTHLLLVPTVEDFDVSLTHFPQYKDYTPRWVVHEEIKGCS